MWQMTCDSWHVTHDRGHMTEDMSIALTVWEQWWFEDWEEMNELLNYWINDKGVFRTALAKQGLLKICKYYLIFSKWQDSRIPYLKKKTGLFFSYQTFHFCFISEPNAWWPQLPSDQLVCVAPFSRAWFQGNL